MPLSLNEIHTPAAAFSREWADAFDEDTKAKSFGDGFSCLFRQEHQQVVSFNEPDDRIKYLSGMLEKHAIELMAVKGTEKGRKG